MYFLVFDFAVYTLLSAYACPTRCPVLTCCIMLPALCDSAMGSIPPSGYGPTHSLSSEINCRHPLSQYTLYQNRGCSSLISQCMLRWDTLPAHCEINCTRAQTAHDLYQECGVLPLISQRADAQPCAGHLRVVLRRWQLAH